MDVDELMDQVQSCTSYVPLAKVTYAIVSDAEQRSTRDATTTKSNVHKVAIRCKTLIRLEAETELEHPEEREQLEHKGTKPQDLCGAPYLAGDTGTEWIQGLERVD